MKLNFEIQEHSENNSGNLESLRGYNPQKVQKSIVKLFLTKLLRIKYAIKLEDAPGKCCHFEIRPFCSY